MHPKSKLNMFCVLSQNYQHYFCLGVTTGISFPGRVFILCNHNGQHRRIQDCLPPGCCKVREKNGGPGGSAPWRGLQGGRAPLPREILHFWTQFVRFGAYFLPTLYHVILKTSLSISNKNFKYRFFFFYHVKPMKMGHFIYPLVPPRVPHSPLIVYMLFCHWGIKLKNDQVI